MKFTNNILIEKLRLLPRHGRQSREGLDPEKKKAELDTERRNRERANLDLERQTIKTENVLKKLANSLEEARINAASFSEIQKSVAKATQGLSNEFTKRSMGLGKTMKFVDDYNKQILKTIKNS